MADDRRRPYVFDAAAAWQDVKRHCRQGIAPGLDTVRSLLAAIGHPERRLGRVVHIAGTNGKGSTAALLAAILRAGNDAPRVSVFSSPALFGPLSSIDLDGYRTGAMVGPLPHEADAEEALAYAARVVAEAAQRLQPTPFEAETAIAFAAIAELHGADDVAIIECGLGGRDDCTNVVDAPAVTIITPIGLDHTAFLGDDVTAIAEAKAGIIKRGAPCIVGRQPEEVGPVLARNAAVAGTHLLSQNTNWSVHEEHGRVVFQADNVFLDLPRPALAGRHQIDNAGMAIMAARLLDAADPVTIASGLRDVTHPGRLQRISSEQRSGVLAFFPRGTDMWVDGGHNGPAAEALAREMAELNDRDPKPLHLIVGALTSKEPADLLGPFQGLAEVVIAAPIPDAALAEATTDCWTSDDIAGTIDGAFADVRAAIDIGHALQLSAAIADGEPVRCLVYGSLHLAAAVIVRDRDDGLDFSGDPDLDADAIEDGDGDREGGADGDEG